MLDDKKNPKKDKDVVGIPSDFVDGRPRVMSGFHSSSAWATDYERVMTFNKRERTDKRLD